MAKNSPNSVSISGHGQPLVTNLNCKERGTEFEQQLLHVLALLYFGTDTNNFRVVTQKERHTNMKFLVYGSYLYLDYDRVHDMTTEELIELRDYLSDMRKMRNLKLPSKQLKFDSRCFQAVWMNAGLDSELIGNLNQMIISRRLEDRDRRTK